MAKRGKTSKRVSLAPIKGFTPIAVDQDGPTPERLAKLPGVTIFTRGSGRKVPALAPGMRSPVGADGIVRVTQSPLDRLAALGRLVEEKADPKTGEMRRDLYLNEMLFQAGDRLRQHWYLAGLDGGPGSIDLDRACGGGGDPAWLTPSSESAAYHRDRFRRAREGMEAGHWQVVFAIACAEETLEGAGRQAGFRHTHAANAVALDRLRRGLELLAIAWGILPPKPANDDVVSPAARAVTRVVEGDAVDAIVDRMVTANAAAAARRVG